MFLLNLLVAVAFGGEIQELKEKILLRATNSARLDQDLKNLNLLSKARAQCEMQLRANKIPVNCYIYIDKKGELDLISSQEKLRLTEIIDRICLNSVENDKSTVIKDAGLLVGKRCQEAINHKIKKNIYFLEESAPENLIIGK